MKLHTLLLLAAIPALAQDHQMAMGDRAMGFSQERTTHHFQLTRGGGLIEVTANDAKDLESRDQIRSHFHHIAQMFADGNFNAPMLVHGRDVPGTAIMTKLKDQIHWEVQETPRGARLNIATTNPEALVAIYQFLRFQIEDHKTGDSIDIR